MQAERGIRAASAADDLMLFQEETPPLPVDEIRAPWRVMIVDDDQDVHTATVFALDKVQILGRRVEFLHASSGTEARRLLARENDIAVLLLDVVMESEDAGLTLVRHIREELQQTDLRIILRTGQPGYAPEIEAIRDYDINDYKTKSELTRSKLYTTLTAATRSYDQIRTINASRRGLDLIVRGSAQLIALPDLREFAAGVLAQLAGLLNQRPHGLVCVPSSCGSGAHDPSGGQPSYNLVAAAGRHRRLADLPLEDVRDDAIRGLVTRALQQRKSVHQAAASVFHITSPSRRDMAVYLETTAPLDSTERALLEVFCSNIAVCFDNIGLLSRLRKQAYFDPLVAWPNRVHFVEHVDRSIAQSGSEGWLVVIVDIDNFAEINDALGHRYGDSLLKQVARRLAEALGDDVPRARVASDVFAVCGRAEADLPHLLSDLFLRPFEVEGVQQTVSATLGIARLADVDGGVDALKAANIALKRAKQERRGQHAYFTREMGVHVRERVKLLADLRGAFAAERLLLHYQPQVRFADRAVVGVEALIRWRTEEGRFISPLQFIPLAEDSGLIVSIGEWVLRTACRQQKALVASGFPGLRMAVNVSVVQFRHPQFLDMLDAALIDTCVDPTLIELEITESLAMLEADSMLNMLDRVKARGVQIAIDDFGTGFSSLSYLQRLKVDRLKIDRSFIAQMSRANAQSIAGMVVELGKHLGLTVIAEGVENAEQAARLIELGCPEAQGYYYARPMDAGQLFAWLHQQQGARAV
jgi:diguanylate cyclase